ncbi:preprotein translocase subunit SecG [Coxiella endosymbiont of Amblyomma sculptum]|uniref:preprotein translocase subunit SecG n=1 Tax=Coxiella endosymbiont of Amblyomma sculptum TaxID=2487929 RepID=UPI00132EE593|nr:preprotein translocase subunit SecG [Coxiella endosymbiont of Amblyomma sculptum]QHG92308.1 preprotein translocase subunit SecG [Coxiella endosymbiont of Amblyomma sculptum]
MQLIALIVHVLVSVFLTGLVLLQRGKGANTSASFGGRTSDTMFGSVGATPFLVKATIVLAAGFFITSIGLSYLASHPLNARHNGILYGKRSVEDFLRIKRS